ncbi:hypothetical protein SAMN04490244_105144 [Tranquillimonas rosea]|uniref:UPF0246 protein SAMN04490244_105144 n=1 Tax=Tranquillimonas rosea TaxID=641238 RepID=A0A1H9UAX6_9RHOB|nr:peroxide stress protein YaaA [Tranquillimonas rosea]SES06317.1 hypothetical protein SAMN04490244_105144 [Tranquillimonas rosea]
MLVVISPAKRLNWEVPASPQSKPDHLKEANILAGHMRQLSLSDLKSLMGLSDDLAKLNRDRFRAFEAEPEMGDTRPAALAFAGDTYQGLDAASLDTDAVTWAQDHLRILSGLYGLLRPRDGIQPYRLEMGSKLKTRRGRNLYDFWGDTLARELTEQAREIGAGTLVNCASQEYFGAVDADALGLDVVTPVFLEDKEDGPKIVSFYAKTARGAMARFIVENRLTDPEALTDFDYMGYRHAPDLSEPGKPAFLRAA